MESLYWNKKTWSCRGGGAKEMSGFRLFAMHHFCPRRLLDAAILTGKRSSESFQTTSISGSCFKKAKEITTKQRNKTDEKTAFYLIGADKF